MTEHSHERSASAASPTQPILTTDLMEVVRRRGSVGSACGVGATVEWLPELGAMVPLPGSGRTIERFSALASIAAMDVSVARVAEPHLDALAILDEAGCAIAGSRSWGVFAAEAPGQRLEARQVGGDWVLSGVKPWCSLGQDLDSAAVTAFTGEGSRRLFAVDLTEPGVSGVAHDWVASGLREIDSGPLAFDDVPAVPVGDDGWYLERPGFEWGAIGVAAVWWGGLVPLCRALGDSASSRDRDLVAIVGRLWQLVRSARLCLEEAARRIDGGERPARDEAAALAHATRGAVVTAVDAACDAARDVMGAAALTQDRGVARRVADLQTYTAQYHRLREPASVGRRVVEGVVTW
jgi:alkylation response protein AidB-like acyl-CoA dehydrogenase